MRDPPKEHPPAQEVLVSVSFCVRFQGNLSVLWFSLPDLFFIWEHRRHLELSFDIYHLDLSLPIPIPVPPDFIWP